MTTRWTARMAEMLQAQGTDLDPKCEHHRSHRATTINVEGPFPGAMWAFEAWKYRDTPGYCVGDDDVSRTLMSTGKWEPIETFLFVNFLESAPGAVIDFGPQIGWYSRIARLMGRDVLAIEAVEEHIDLLTRNASGVDACRHWVDHNSLPLDPDGAPDIAIVKMDIEGMEREALRMIRPLIDAGNVASILMEVSPIFNDSYPGVVSWLLSNGYEAQTCSPRWPVTLDNYREVLAQTDQVDMLFRRNR